MEEILYEKLDKRKRDRNNSHETLGQIMVDAGNEFGPGTSYGESSFNHFIPKFIMSKYFRNIFDIVNSGMKWVIFIIHPISRPFNKTKIFLSLNQNICCGYSKEPSQ